jgi:hypothetical protein
MVIRIRPKINANQGLTNVYSVISEGLAKTDIPLTPVQVSPMIAAQNLTHLNPHSAFIRPIEFEPHAAAPYGLTVCSGNKGF